MSDWIIIGFIILVGSSIAGFLGAWFEYLVWRYF